MDKIFRLDFIEKQTMPKWKLFLLALFMPWKWRLVYIGKDLIGVTRK